MTVLTAKLSARDPASANVGGGIASASRLSSVPVEMPDGHVWNDKYADNHRLQIDLDLAHAEIRRLGGVVPEPCGPVVIRSVARAELEPVVFGRVVEVEYTPGEKTSAEE